jgi:PII interaction protein X
MSPVSSLAKQTLAHSKSTTSETYINHPTFGLLYRVSLIEETQELFATLYAQRLFFLVTSTSEGVQFDPIGRTDSRLLVESRLRNLRRQGQSKEYEQLQKVHRQTFQ